MYNEPKYCPYCGSSQIRITSDIVFVDIQETVTYDNKIIEGYLYYCKDCYFEFYIT